MQFKPLNITTETAKAILPGRIQGLIGLPTTMVFGAIDKEELLGVAVCSMISPTCFCINHIEKAGDGDERTYEVLLTNMESFFRENGARSIVARIIAPPEPLLETASALRVAGFVPSTLSGHFMMYSFEQIVNTDFFEHISQGNVQLFFTRIKTYRQLSKQQLNDFSKAMRTSKYHGPVFNPDKKSSRYYIADDRIRGYMDATFDGEDTFYIRDIFVPRNKEEKSVLHMLMASIFVEMKETCDESGTLIISVHRQDVYKWFKAIFKESLMEENIFEFVKVM